MLCVTFFTLIAITQAGTYYRSEDIPPTFPQYPQHRNSMRRHPSSGFIQHIDLRPSLLQPVVSSGVQNLPWPDDQMDHRTAWAFSRRRYHEIMSQGRFLRERQVSEMSEPLRNLLHSSNDAEKHQQASSMQIVKNILLSNFEFYKKYRSNINDFLGTIDIYVNKMMTESV